MNDKILLTIVIVTLIVASASLTQTFLLTVAVNDQSNHIDQVASQVGGLAGVVSSLMASGSTQSSPTTQSNNVVYLEVVPDFGGSTYDAFVVPGSLGGSTPNATSTGAPPNNNITVVHGVPIKFVIINIDTALNENFTGHVTVPFTLYNDSTPGEVALQYTQGETISDLPISHTFSIADLQVNIPIPADTMVVFTYTFSASGVYAYVCTTPCGPGMGLAGYMLGYVIVT